MYVRKILFFYIFLPPAPDEPMLHLIFFAVDSPFWLFQGWFRTLKMERGGFNGYREFISVKIIAYHLNFEEVQHEY